MTLMHFSNLVARLADWSQRRAPIVIFVLGLALLVPGTWSESGITEIDESLTLRTPLEMIEHNSWLTPWLEGEPRFRKPPLMYWAIAATYKVFGVHLLCGRIWGGLLGAGMAAGVVLLARELFRSDGLLAGLMTLATFGVSMAGREAMLNLPVATLCTFGVYFFFRWRRHFAIGWLLVSAAALAAGALVKGPVALVFYGGAVLTWPVVCKGWAELGKHWRHWLLALTVFFVLALPWPVWALMEWGGQYTSSLQAEAAEIHLFDFSKTAPGAAVGGALLLAFPWTPIALIAIWDGLRGKDGRARRERVWLIAWYGASIAPFLFMITFERYTIGLVPPLVILAAEWLERQPGGNCQRLLCWSLGPAAAIILALAGLVWWLVPGWNTLGIALIMAAGVAITCLHLRPQVTAFGFAVLMAVFWAASYPQLGIGRMPREMPAELRLYPARLFGSEPKLLCFRLGYSLQRFRASEWSEGKLSSQDRLIVFVKADHVDDFQATLARHGLESQLLHRFRTCIQFPSRWRRDVSGEQLRDALASRSLERLKSYYHSYLVGPAEGGAPTSRK